MNKQADPIVAENIHLTYREKDRLRLRQLKKHHVSTILLHWFNALSWLFLLTTGAALLTSPYYRIMPQWFIDVVHGIFGGSANMLKFHIWLGVIWIIVITVYTIFGYRRYVRKLPVRTIKEERSIWHDRLMALQCLFFGNENLCLDKDDINWLRIRLLQMLKKTDEPLPPQGSFNAGQKLFGLLVALMTPVIMLTGLIMAFHILPAAFVRWSIVFHFFAVGSVVAGLMIHVYMGAVFPEEKPAFFSMITSYVHELFAFRHHFKWWVEMILEEWHWRQKEEPHVTLRDVLRERFEGNDKLVDELVNAIAEEEKVDFVEKLLAVRRASEEGTRVLPYWNPYVAGITLGFVLLATFVIMGRGLGASSAYARLVAFLWGLISPDYVMHNEVWSRYFAHGHSPLINFGFYLIIGVFIGGWLSGFTAGRLGISVDKGPRISKKQRYLFAFLGGILMGIGARIARGCTSGLALTGGATLALGAWVFMIMVFLAGFVGAYIFRRIWL